MAAPLAGEPAPPAVFVATFTRWEDGYSDDDTDHARRKVVLGVFPTEDEAARALVRALVEGRWVTRRLTAAARVETWRAAEDDEEAEAEEWFRAWNSEPWADEQVAAVRTLACVRAFIQRSGPAWERDRDLGSGIHVDIERMELGARKSLVGAACGNLAMHQYGFRTWLPPWD